MLRVRSIYRTGVLRNSNAQFRIQGFSSNSGDDVSDMFVLMDVVTNRTRDDDPKAKALFYSLLECVGD